MRYFMRYSMRHSLRYSMRHVMRHFQRYLLRAALQHALQHALLHGLRLLSSLAIGLLPAVLGLGAAYAQSGAPQIAASATAKDPNIRGLQSGFWQMSGATQAMQTDDRQNPAMLWVQSGQALWDAAPAGAGAKASPAGAGAGAKSCAACHGSVQTLRGVAARYPTWNTVVAAPANLGQAINACRTQHQGAAAWPPEHVDLLGLEALVALQSRGLPISRPSERAAALTQTGEALFGRRMGQLNLSCAQCHDQLAAGVGSNGPPRLGAAPIPQGHPSGYPIYRLEWQTLGSLQRRIRNCMSGVRAQAYPWGASELLALELYLAKRAVGLEIDAPAVRP